MGKVFRPRIVIPESFDLCLTYEQQIFYLANMCEKLSEKIVSMQQDIDELRGGN